MTSLPSIFSQSAVNVLRPKTVLNKQSNPKRIINCWTSNSRKKKSLFILDAIALGVNTYCSVVCQSSSYCRSPDESYIYSGPERTDKSGIPCNFISFIQVGLIILLGTYVKTLGNAPYWL
nr:uncharacterized protein LOC106686831 [Halyomorpha halys]